MCADNSNRFRIFPPADLISPEDQLITELLLHMAPFFPSFVLWEDWQRTGQRLLFADVPVSKMAGKDLLEDKWRRAEVISEETRMNVGKSET